jgi:hypothetical protein
LRLDLKRYSTDTEWTEQFQFPGMLLGMLKPSYSFLAGASWGKKTLKPQDAWTWSSIICSTTIRAQKGMAE